MKNPDKLFEAFTIYIQSKGINPRKKFTVGEIGAILDECRKVGDIDIKDSNSYNYAITGMFANQKNRDYFSFLNKSIPKELTDIANNTNRDNRKWKKIYEQEELYINKKYIKVNVNLSKSDKMYKEGRKILVDNHMQIERNKKVIKNAKALFYKKHKRLFCEICGFDFEKAYGKLGEGFIEAHHINPVSKMKDGDETSIEDIMMVCSNCHSIIHRNIDIDLEDIKKIFK
ncbi:HNH endonuclease [Romboutsia lituseburensis]|nr:HNH endonuclease [Romboutsia lituseburensis]